MSNINITNNTITTDSDEYSICSICLEEVTNNVNVSITQCGHKFHCSCMLSIHRNNIGISCPLCRTLLVIPSVMPLPSHSITTPHLVTTPHSDTTPHSVTTPHLVTTPDLPTPHFVSLHRLRAWLPPDLTTQV